MMEEFTMNDPLVLLPGMMCDARLFEHQMTVLSRDRAVMIAPITKGDRVEDIAASILDSLPERFALAGLSMGGIVAMEIMRRVPDRISRFCLMDTNPLAETPAAAASREPMIIATKAGRLDDVMRDTMRSEYLAPGPQGIKVLNLVYEMARDLGPEVFVAQSRALQRRMDQQGTLRRCKVPTLVLCGQEDRLTPLKRHEFMAELIPNGVLCVIPDAGHLPTLEQPELTTRALQQWLTAD